MPPKYQDYYEALGVPRDATQQQIQSAYRKLARTYHPDVNTSPGAEERFKRVGEAFEVLGDPEKRRKYDQLGSGWRGGDDFTPPPGWEQFRRGRPASGRAQSSGAFSDFFESLFGREFRPFADRGRNDGSGRRGESRDQEADVTISLEEAFRGGKKPVTFEEIVSSPTGRVRRKTKKLDITIPPGVHDGTKLRLPGQGQAGPRGSTPGDLYLTIHLRPHPRFRVAGSDLELDLSITPWEALFGARVQIPVIGGQAVITVPAGSQSGKKLRLKGRGLRKTKDSRGDLYAVVRVVVPVNPTEQERKLFAELAKVSAFRPRG